jgi:phage gp45-like
MSASLVARLQALIGKCLLRAIAVEGGGFRKLQIQTRADSLRDGVDHFEAYGLTAAPHPADNPIGVVAELGAMAGLPVVLVVHCAAPRPRDLAPGEVALYSRFEQIVKLDHDGNVTIAAPGNIVLQAGGDIVGTAQGSAELDGATEARLRSAARTVVECNGHGSAILPDRTDTWTDDAVAGDHALIAAPRIP